MLVKTKTVKHYLFYVYNKKEFCTCAPQKAMLARVELRLNVTQFCKKNNPVDIGIGVEAGTPKVERKPLDKRNGFMKLVAASVVFRYQDIKCSIGQIVQIGKQFANSRVIVLRCSPVSTIPVEQLHSAL